MVVSKPGFQQFHLKVYNFHFISGIGLYGAFLCLTGYGWIRNANKIITVRYILLPYNSIELSLECIIVYHIFTKITWGIGGKNLSNVG